MTLLRRVLGETLRGRRLRQRRTLREVSSAARVSLGYLSEVERGQKEASSELLASICDALDVKLSDLLREVSETMRRSERAAEVARMPGRVILPAPARQPVPAGVGGGRPEMDRPEIDRPDLDFDAEFGPEFGAEFGPELPELDSDGSDADPFAGRSTDAPAGATDSIAVPEPGDLAEVGPGDLDGVDLAELEAGDELGDLDLVLARTELAAPYDGPYGARCLAAVA
jgi:transcriptional regulator with XRE-family HTH domain